MTQFCIASYWNCCCFSNWTITAHLLNYNIWSGIDSISMGMFQNTSLNDLTMRLWQFSMSETGTECRCSSYSWLHTQICGFYALGKGAIMQLAKWQWHWKKKKIMDCAFPIDCICHAESICLIKFMVEKCVVHMSAWCHIESTENKFSIWVAFLLSFQYWGCGMKHHPWNLCTLCMTERH